MERRLDSDEDNLTSRASGPAMHVGCGYPVFHIHLEPEELQLLEYIQLFCDHVFF